MTQFRTCSKLTTAWSMEELELRLQDKIMQRTSKSSDQFRQAFKLFTVAGGITPDMFLQQINKILGVNISKEISLKLFEKYDTDKSGDIDLSEFVNGIMPRDWEYVPPSVRKFPRLSETTIRHQTPEPQTNSKPPPHISTLRPKSRGILTLKPPKGLGHVPTSPLNKIPMKPKDAFRRTKPASPAVRKASRIKEVAPVAEPQPQPNQKSEMVNEELWKSGKLDEGRIASLTNISRTLREQEKRDSRQGKRMGKAMYKSRFVSPKSGTRTLK